MKAVELEASATIEIKNLMAAYPGADRLYTIQLMGATLCGMLKGSTLPDGEKLDRWSRFQDASFGLLTAPSGVKVKE